MPCRIHRFFGFPAIESESLRSFKSDFWVAGCGQVIHVIRSDKPTYFDCFCVRNSSEIHSSSTSSWQGQMASRIGWQKRSPQRSPMWLGTFRPCDSGLPLDVGRPISSQYCLCHRFPPTCLPRSNENTKAHHHSAPAACCTEFREGGCR